jgi:hypothetical protein
MNLPFALPTPLSGGTTTMQKQTIQYDSVVDALVAVAKRLSRYEIHYNMESEDFFNRYSNGQMGDDLDFVEWANDYQHFLAIRSEVEKHTRHAA